ncbi:hypothetical protein BX600DRAFT_447922, partial [Xylariales sp. PMI_506]
MGRCDGKLSLRWGGSNYFGLEIFGLTFFVASQVQRRDARANQCHSALGRCGFAEELPDSISRNKLSVC